MNARVFANTTSLSLTADLDGSEFVAPVIPAFQTISLQFRPSKEIEGVGVRDARAIRAVATRIGWPDEDPTQGAFDLTISLGATDAEVLALPYNLTAASLKSAIDTALATPLASLVPCTVTDYAGGLRIVFKDNAAAVEIECTDNALWPLSFVEIDEIEWDEGRAYILDLRQAPVAEVAGALETVPTAPSIKVSPEPGTQAGGDIDGYLINEIQKLEIPAEFAGASFILKRDKKSAPLTSPPTLEQVQAALETIKDEDGIFVVTLAPGGVYIEFQGSMAGMAQDPIEVEVFESPGTEYLVTLSTRTPGMRELMRNADAAGRVEVPLNLDFEIAHPFTEGVWIPQVISLPLTFSRPVATGDRNVSASLRYDQPMSKRDYGRHSTDALLIGNRGMKFTIGNGSSTSFPLAHNLVENPQTVTANATTNKLACVDHGYQDLDPITFSTSGTLPAPLVAGTLYFVRDASSNDFKVALTANGTAIDLTDTGAGTHTARLKDGTTEGVQVEVWEAGGDEERLPQSSYTVARTSLDVVTLSGFPTIPTSGQYHVYVQTVGRPASYQGATWGIDDTPEAKQRIEALEARVAALEATSPSLLGVRDPSPGKYFRESSLPNFSEVLPASGRSGRFRVPVGSRHRDFDVTALGRGTGRLFGALHKASTVSLDSIDVVEGGVKLLPVASSSFINAVYVNDTGQVIDIPGGGGHPSRTLAAGEFCACDGDYFYKVVQYGSASNTSYYPVGFERTLFVQGISGQDLISGRAMEVRWDIELGLLEGAESGFVYYLVIERGTWPSDTSPSTTGGNLQNIIWADDAVHSERILLTTTPDLYSFGYRVSRVEDTLTALALSYGVWKSATAPAATDFAIRARLIRGDTENAADTPNGRAWISGPTFDDSLPEVGKMRIF